MLRVSSPLNCRIVLQRGTKNIGDCREGQSELIRTHPPGGAAVGKQIKLLFIDAILHIAASTVDIFIQRVGIPFFSRCLFPAIPVIYLTFNISHCFRILSRQKSESPRKRTSGNLALIVPTSFTRISSVPSQASRLDGRSRAIRGKSSQNT